MIYTPYQYQEYAEQHVLDHPYCGLLLEMALGKTVITLSAIDKLMNQELEINKTLVIAPKRVAEIVWKEEAEKWNHLNHLKISVVAGSEKQRLAALKAPADIYTIGRDNVSWLVRKFMTAFPFDMVVIDESSSFKNPNSSRFKSLRIVRPRVKRVVILTGTPTPNGLVDLWPQMFLVDQGERLEKHITDYRRKYFTNTSRSNNYNKFEINKDSEKAIYKRISDVCISMKTRDYIKLPEYVVTDVKVNMTDKEQQMYDEFERDQVLKLVYDADINDLLGLDVEISALSAVALSNKLLQFANGAVYDSGKQWHEIHQQKLDALEEIIESAQGEPMLVAYSFQHDVHRILNRFKCAKVLKTKEDLKEWDNGKIVVGVVHPASMGHGLNMQYGGSIITWFGQTWSLELYDQLNARLRRPGQQKLLRLYRILTAKTMDYDVIRAIKLKAKGQDALMEAVKARIKKYTI